MSRVLSFCIEETGVVKDYAGSTAPSGYLMCFGQAVSRTTYASLFAVIGTAFGAGDGSETFNVPDVRGRASIGKDDMGGAAASRMTAGGGGIDGASLGAAGGAQAHTLTDAQMPVHTHANTVTDPGHVHANTMSDPGHSHAYIETLVGGGGGSVPNYFYSSAVGSLTSHAQTGITLTNASQASGVTITNASQGAGAAHPIVQPGIVFNKIIKT